MSRSRKKAIIKDKGHRREDYWKVHRRVNKQIVKSFCNTTNVSDHVKWFSQYEEFKKFYAYYLKVGFAEEEAWDMADYETEDDFYFSRMSSNLFRSWWEYPECRNPRELVNDYDFSDYRIDYEYDKRRGYFFDHSGEDNSEKWHEDRKKWKDKFSRK